MISKLEIQMNVDEGEFFSAPAFAMLEKQISNNTRENHVQVQVTSGIDISVAPGEMERGRLTDELPLVVMETTEKFVNDSIRESSPCKGCSAMMVMETEDFKASVFQKKHGLGIEVNIRGVQVGCSHVCDESWIDSAAWTIQRDLHHKKGARVDSRRELEDYLKHRIKLVDEDVEAELEKRNPPFKSGAYSHTVIMPAVMNMDDTTEMLKSRALMDLKQEVITGRMYERYEAHRNKVTKVEKKSGIPKTQADVIW